MDKVTRQCPQSVNVSAIAYNYIYIKEKKEKRKKKKKPHTHVTVNVQKKKKKSSFIGQINQSFLFLFFIIMTVTPITPFVQECGF